MLAYNKINSMFYIFYIFLESTILSTVSSQNNEYKTYVCRFMIYLKLCILMNVLISIRVLLSVITHFVVEQLVLYIITSLLETITHLMKGPIIFIVFLCQKRIKQLLLKRFSCDNIGLYGKKSTSNNCHITTSHTSFTEDRVAHARSQFQHQ